MPSPSDDDARPTEAAPAFDGTMPSQTIAQAFRAQGLTGPQVFPERAGWTSGLDAVVCLALTAGTGLAVASRTGQPVLSPVVMLAMVAALLVTPFVYPLLSIRGRTLGGLMNGTRYVDPMTFMPAPRLRVGIGLLVTALSFPLVLLVVVLLLALSVLMLMSDSDESPAGAIGSVFGWFFAEAPRDYDAREVHQAEQAVVAATVLTADTRVREATAESVDRRRPLAIGHEFHVPG